MTTIAAYGTTVHRFTPTGFYTMYGIFEISGGSRKFQVFNGDTFTTREDAINIIPSVLFSEMDDDHDAADVMTKGGMVYAVERVAA